MNQQVKDKLDQARDEVLRKQRKCAWCDHLAQTEDGLVRHILETHPKRNGKEGLTEREQELLTLLQKQDAK